MPTQPAGRAPLPEPRRPFPTTRWSVVVEAGRSDSPESRRALSALCESYWYPLYAYARRRGNPVDDAVDLTQEFFTQLLDKRWLESADPQKGRFRTFLLTAFQRFAGREQRRRRAQKRGGGWTRLSLDWESAERRYQVEPAHSWTAERLYQRRWALTLLDRVLTTLERECARPPKAALFERLKACLTSDADALPYARLAEQLSMTEGAVKVAVHRLKGRYREILREEIAQTIASTEEVDDELNRLLASLRGDG